MIQIALIGVPPVFTHGHSFGWHEYFLAEFFQGLNFRGLPHLLEAVFFLLGAADYLALMAAASMAFWLQPSGGYQRLVR